MIGEEKHMYLHHGNEVREVTIRRMGWRDIPVRYPWRSHFLYFAFGHVWLEVQRSGGNLSLENIDTGQQIELSGDLLEEFQCVGWVHDDIVFVTHPENFCEQWAFLDGEVWGEFFGKPNRDVI